MLETWEEHQAWEAGWWSNCCNIYEEELKQLVYAQRMDPSDGSAGVERSKR